MRADRELLAVAEEAVDAGADWLGRAGEEWARKRFKASGEEVTDADVEVERLVTGVLRSRTPDVPVVGEESADGAPLPSRCWLLDPIDGTMNFVRQGPMYALSLAFVDRGKPALGVIHAPALGRRWTTGSGSGGPQASGVGELSRAIVGITGTGSGTFVGAAALTGLLHDRAYRIRMHGAMSLDLAGVAEGWLDACVCVGPRPWDVAAGTALVRQRGLAVLGGGGRPFDWDSPVLLAGPEPVARLLADLWDSLDAHTN
ncbi:inositol monophosphatase family protein [Streptomyces sp. NPDC049040]|uniref:inositol monophosphatase family protein n=1 Tax=Streptomyces sp. NPDC049040 TaxID=3365593 RepID=UPI00372367BF